MILPILFTLFAVCNSQSLFDLKSFDGMKDTPITANGPYAVYVSASSDDESLLKQVKIKTSDNQEKTLYDLKMNKLYQNSGLLQPFQVTTSAVVSSSLNDEKMNQLKGYLYITTTKQLQNNKGFFVYNVEVSEKIQIAAGLLPDDCTIVFLNSDYNAPWQSSTISQWTQVEGTSVYLFEGIPKDTEEKKNSHIFSNPVVISEGNSKFFKSVEKFSLKLGSFYFKTYKGVQFVIDPNFSDIDNYRATAKTTTGLYMKPFTSPDRKVIVNFNHDNNYNGTTGVNVIGSVPQTASFVVSGPGNWIINPSETIQGKTFATITDTLGLETINSVAGEVFVQYFTIEGDQLISTSRPTRTTPRGIESTTKSSAVFQLVTSVLIPFIGARYL
uniref:Thermopsin n=1 Tax=Caenorhabditis tropicalis TaxID=1561998 RepID=A0A1I7T5W2_9PELO